MRSLILSLIILASGLPLPGGIAIVHAQKQETAIITGNITNANSGAPLKEAHVYLSGTKIGTATTSAGRYRLRNVPPGGHRVVISMIGYKHQVVTMVIGPGETRELDAKLTPVTYSMGSIYVRPDSEKWEQNVDRFTENFIGQSPWADSVRILNPEVLSFDQKWWGKLEAEALAPLQIENHALGYRITYQLKEFSHSGGLTRWDGEPLFEEMTAADSAQADYWRVNRRKAFYGSMRHFLLALLNDRVQDDGFILYQQRPTMYGYSQRNRRRISGRQLIREGDKDYIYDMNFSGTLEIIYTNEEEETEYVEWIQKQRYRGPVDNQTSFLELNEHPVTVDADGEIVQPYGATQFGYYAYERLGALTPRQYRPEDYD